METEREAGEVGGGGYAVFAGDQCLGTGTLEDAAIWARTADRRKAGPGVLVFEDATGQVVDLDLRGSEPQVRRRYRREAVNGVVGTTVAEGPGESRAEEPRGRGRPRLGVVAREVTLLPRHWEWLADQPGGASVALRKLVEQARRDNAEKDRLRRRREACYRVMSALAGNAAGFEEATRALFAGDREKFRRETRTWGEDVRRYVGGLAEGTWGGVGGVRGE